MLKEKIKNYNILYEQIMLKVENRLDELRDLNIPFKFMFNLGYFDFKSYFLCVYGKDAKIYFLADSHDTSIRKYWGLVPIEIQVLFLNKYTEIIKEIERIIDDKISIMKQFL